MGALEKILTRVLVLYFRVENLTNCYFGGLLRMKVILEGRVEKGLLKQ